MIKTVDKDKILSIKEEKNLSISLIKQNITQPLDFYIKNLKNNKITYSYDKIKNLLKTIREIDIPKNEEILSNIANIKINFKNSKNQFDEVSFCLSNGKFINIRYKNRLEKYIIFSSLYQLKMGLVCNEYFVDGTFKSAPKGYYIKISSYYFHYAKSNYKKCKYFHLFSKNKKKIQL